MVDINFQQYKMLKHIDHVHRILTDNFSTEELEICEFLYSKEFLSITKKTRYTSDNKIDLFGLHLAEYTITQAGKAQLSAYEASFHKWWFSVVIALISLAVSIIALLC